ncbi:MAG TPA: hypothetical protein VFA85_06920 [Terriglobales bacterium]|nr:hypothetical protein [Terriglobales bacterium]
MRKFAGLSLCVFTIAGAAFAQIPTSGNIFVGYSYSRTNSVPGNTVSLNGWEGSLEGKFLPWIGIVADFGTTYGSNNNPIPAITCPISGCPALRNDVKRSTYLFGPRASVPIGRFTPFAHFLVGAAHVNDRGVTDTSFATAIGGGLDYRLIHGLALRLQGDEIHTNFFSVGENQLRFSTGIDIRF